MNKFNLQANKIWQDSIGAVQKFWQNYLNTLSTYFRNMSRNEQEELITKLTVIIVIGGTALIWYFIYPLFLSIIRVIALPITLILAFWFGRNIASKIVIERVNSYLNEE